MRNKRYLLVVQFCLSVSLAVSFSHAQTTDVIPREKSPTPQEEVSASMEPIGPFDPLKKEVKQSREQQQANGYKRPSSDKRLKRFVNSVIGPVTLARSAARAGISTATNSPEEWGKDAEGFGRRFASNLGSNAIKQGTIFAIDESLKIDSRFYKSGKKDFGSKVKNAFLSTVTARNKRGKRVFGVSRVVGTYSAAVISREAWYPKRFNYKDGLKSGSISLGVNAAVNLIREFF